jgi:hypothetical protein
VIVKASSGPGYVVGCCNKVDKEKLVAGTRVAFDMTTLTIMQALPREVISHVSECPFLIIQSLDTFGGNLRIFGLIDLKNIDSLLFNRSKLV